MKKRVAFPLVCYDIQLTCLTSTLMFLSLLCHLHFGPVFNTYIFILFHFQGKNDFFFLSFILSGNWRANALFYQVETNTSIVLCTVPFFGQWSFNLIRLVIENNHFVQLMNRKERKTIFSHFLVLQRKIWFVSFKNIDC